MENKLYQPDYRDDDVIEFTEGNETEMDKFAKF